MLKLNFTEAREDVFEVYTKRGYESARDFINMLINIDVITLTDVEMLNDLLVALELSNKGRIKR